MSLPKRLLPIAAYNIAALVAFSFLFLARGSYEFVAYVAMMLTLMALVFASLPAVRYSTGLLWGLSVWATLHMAGGAVYIAGRKLYATMLVPLNDEILRYDQVVHTFGFFVATLLIYELVKFIYPKRIEHKIATGLVIVMAGLGLGALNEIFEFLLTLAVPKTDVGGYVNTSLDLVADLLGALLAWTVILTRERRDAKIAARK